MTDNGLSTAALAALASRDAAGLLRHRTEWEPTGPVTVRSSEGEFVNFASNNYLGLTHHPRLVAVLREQSVAGAGAAGLISGHSPVHARAEATLAEWKGQEAAVLLPSGYQANLAIVQTLTAIGGTGGVRFLLDKLVHASLVDAVRLSGVGFRVFPHNGLDKLDRLLGDAPAGQMQVVLTESIFSMDGDAADLGGLAALKARRPFVLVVDEAHGTGVYGPGGAGMLAEVGVGVADVVLVTLSKALGIAGAAVCGSAAFINALQNFGRAYVYSTAVPPATAALASAAVAVCRSEPEHQSRVRRLARDVRSELARGGLRVPDGDAPIVPIVLGDAEETVAAATRLRAQGLLVVAVRPPTVAVGTSRLRVTLSAAHSDEQVQRLCVALRSLHA